MSELTGVSAKRVQGSEAFQRMNYLYQAAVAVYPQSPKLSQFYIRTMRNVAEKTVLRLAPGVKAGFCQKCSYLLVYLQRDVQKGGNGKVYASVKCPGCGKERKSRLRA